MDDQYMLDDIPGTDLYHESVHEGDDEGGETEIQTHDPFDQSGPGWTVAPGKYGQVVGRGRAPFMAVARAYVASYDQAGGARGFDVFWDKLYRTSVKTGIPPNLLLVTGLLGAVAGVLYLKGE